MVVPLLFTLGGILILFLILEMLAMEKDYKQLESDYDSLEREIDVIKRELESVFDGGSDVPSSSV